MSQEKVLGEQLNIIDVANEITADPTAISSIATGITTDTGAIAIFDADYLRRDGTTTMSADLDIGINNIVNVGTVDGRTISTDGTNLDTHIADPAIHFIEAAIVHANLVGVTGTTNTHADIDNHIAKPTIHFTEASIDHANLVGVTGTTNTHAVIDTHIANGTIHFTEASIDHTNILNKGTITHADIDAHIGDLTRHFTVSSIVHDSMDFSGIGGMSNNHAAIDLHIADPDIHLAMGDIDHFGITNIGTNTHVQIDSHITNGTIHFTQASIQINESQVTNLVGKYEIANANIQTHIGIVAGNPHGTSLDDLADVSVIGATVGQVLTLTGSPGTWSAQTLSAVDIINVPAGNIAASDVQAAIAELDTEKAPIASPVFTGDVKFPSYTVVEANDGTTIPVGTSTGGMIYVSDATNVSSGAAAATGAMCFSNGTIWIDVTTGIAVV